MDILFFTLVLFAVIFIGLAMRALKRTDPKQYQNLGGSKAVWLPPYNMFGAGYFLGFGYRGTWQNLAANKKYFVLASLSLWGVIALGSYGLFNQI